MSKKLVFSVQTAPNQPPAPVEVKFRGEAILEIAQAHGIANGNQLAQKAGISGPNFYENFNGSTFPALGTICKLLAGAGLDLSEVKGVTLGDIFCFEALETLEA